MCQGSLLLSCYSDEVGVWEDAPGRRDANARQLVGAAGLRRRNLLTAKKRWATRTIEGSQREAERALAAFVTEIDRGVTVAAGATVGELLERWFE